MAGRIQVRPVVALKGEGNLKEWRGDLLAQLEHLELDQYVLEAVSQPEDVTKRKKWKEERLAARLLIVDSTEEVQNILENHGWDRFTDKDPKNLYDLIIRVIPQASEDLIQQLVTKWNHQTPEGTFQEYLDTAIKMRRRLDELGYKIPDNVAILTIMGPLKMVDEQWYDKIFYDFINLKSTWATIVGKIQTKINQMAADTNPLQFTSI